MAEVVQPEDRPALAVLPAVPEINPFGFQAVIAIRSEVNAPSDPIHFEHKRARIHVAVIRTG